MALSQVAHIAEEEGPIQVDPRGHPALCDGAGQCARPRPGGFRRRGPGGGARTRCSCRTATGWNGAASSRTSSAPRPGWRWWCRSRSALIFLLLYFTFNSVRQAALVFCNVPFAAIGGVVALWASGEFLSVPASVGFIALVGIAVLNGVVLVSYINRLIAEDGLSLLDGVMEGARRRMTPVILTATIAAFGLVPFLFADRPGLRDPAAAGDRGDRRAGDGDGADPGAAADPLCPLRPAQEEPPATAGEPAHARRRRSTPMQRACLPAPPRRPLRYACAAHRRRSSSALTLAAMLFVSSRAERPSRSASRRRAAAAGTVRRRAARNRGTSDLALALDAAGARAHPRSGSGRARGARCGPPSPAPRRISGSFRGDTRGPAGGLRDGYGNRRPALAAGAARRARRHRHRRRGEQVEGQLAQRRLELAGLLREA